MADFDAPSPNTGAFLSTPDDGPTVEEMWTALARAEEVLESIGDGFYAVDEDFHFTYVNRRAEELWGRPRAELLGRRMPEAFPAVTGTPSFAYHLRAMAERTPCHYETLSPVLGRWVAVSIYPGVRGISVYFQDIHERKFLEAERERLLAEAQARAGREALLNRIGAAIRATTDPDEVQATAAALLGEALGADRCYFSVYDPSGHGVRIGRDFHRADLPSVSGDYPLAEYEEYVGELYARGTAVVNDARSPAVPPIVRRVLAGVGMRAFLAVPLLDGGRFVAAVAASMTDGPRVWAPDEIRLMEAVLTQTRAAAEAARAARRERTISRQLQEALQPALPDSVPGMRLSKHFEAALADTEGVGGDFYDVFRLDKGCSALVVGDLSGKGLQAAAHVAVVRNMLRAFLHSKPTLAEAVTDLNRVLALNDLLSGFATLWVGCFDGASGRLSYVNCGQEPALVRRAATGQVEELSATGPVLGAVENAVYAEQTVALAPGDVLAVFTDGLTECGASRRAMLGVEGVSALLAQPVGPASAADQAEAVRARLVAGVEAASRGGVARDDMCLLVGVVQGGKTDAFPSVHSSAPRDGRKPFQGRLDAQRRARAGAVLRPDTLGTGRRDRRAGVVGGAPRKVRGPGAHCAGASWPTWRRSRVRTVCGAARRSVRRAGVHSRAPGVWSSGCRR